MNINSTATKRKTNIKPKETTEKNLKNKKNNKTPEKNDIRNKRTNKYLLILLLPLLCVIIYSYLYFKERYHATEYALNYIKSTDEVKVYNEKSAYFFDGPGTDKAFIFYQGAKIDEEAYAGIMHDLAKNGIDCYLAKMPLRFAFMNVNAASDIIKNSKNHYDKWYIGGHSLGGAIAAIYTASHRDDIDGLAMFASYSIKQIPDKIKVLSFISSNDKVLNWKKYKENLKNLPNNYTEILIKGGNHGNFGDYGIQKKDGESDITKEEQHQQIVETILKYFN